MAEAAAHAQSGEQIVGVLGMMARLGLESGPATIRADQGRYNLETETVTVTGPVLFTAADGYRIQTRDVAVDLDTRTMESDGGVEGRLPLGRFAANRMSADLEGRTVTLTGTADRKRAVKGKSV